MRRGEVRALQLAFVLLCLLTACAAPGPEIAAHDDEQQWYCAATALSARAGAVDVQTYVHRDGRPVVRAMLWSPPAIRRQNLAGEPGGLLDLTIHAPIDANGRKSEQGSITVSVATGTESLLNAQVVLEAGGATATATIERFEPLPLPPPARQTAFHIASFGPNGDNAAILVNLNTASTMSATIRAEDGHVMASATYDLTGRPEVADLTRRALLHVERNRRHPLTLCNETRRSADAPTELEIVHD